MPSGKINRLGRIEHQPAASDFLVGPVASRPYRYAEHNVYMVAHNSVSAVANRENLTQLLHARFDYRLAMRKRICRCNCRYRKAKRAARSEKRSDKRQLGQVQRDFGARRSWR